MPKTRYFTPLAISLSLAITTLSPLSAPAQEVGNASVFERLHMANALRNNTQYMARVACYAFAGYEPEHQREELARASAEFSEISVALLAGDAERGMAPEANQRVINALDALRDAWPVLENRIDRIVREERIDKGEMAEIDMFSLNLMTRSDDLSTRMANVYSETLNDVPLILILTVDMAERQIMRTEKAGKDACLIGVGVNVIENRADLEKTVAVFSATLGALISGFPGMIMAAPNAEIRDLLNEAEAAWQAPKALLTILYQGGEITTREREVIRRGLEEVAAKMEMVAALYVALETR